MEAVQEILSRRILEEKNKRKARRVWVWALAVAVFCLTCFIVFQYVLGVSVVHGESMEPALGEGDVILYLRNPQRIDRTDIVLLSGIAEREFIKRIAALPGDTVEVKYGLLYINGTPENDSASALPVQEDARYPITLAEEQYFVLGDNREDSFDSRSEDFGTVDRAQIEGRLLLIIWHGSAS